MAPLDRNARNRLAALKWCDELRLRWGDHVPAAALSPFPFEDESVHLRGQQGIFKPRQLTDGPLTIRQALDSPCNDDLLGGGTGLKYDFAPRSRESENRGLASLAGTGTPLIYLIQVSPKSRGVEYLVVSPVFVSGCSVSSRCFLIALEGRPALGEIAGEGLVPPQDATQAYCAFSSSRSRGWRWAWTFAVGRRRCASTTARPTRSQAGRQAARP